MIKPCPFCGGNAKMSIQENDYRTLAIVICKKCGAERYGKSFPTYHNIPRSVYKRDAMKTAIEIWNERIDNTNKAN